MSVLEIVENPRRGVSRDKRGRFKRRGRSVRRRRRNPGLATWANPRAGYPNPRRRRRRRPVSRRRVRRYANPAFLGVSIDTSALLHMAGGALAVKLLPRFVKQVWPGMPTSGIAGNLMSAGLAIGLGVVGRQLLGRRAAGQLVQGGLVSVLVDVLEQTLLPAVGLGGYRYLTPSEMAPLLGGYVYRGRRSPVSPAVPGRRVAALV